MPEKLQENLQQKQPQKNSEGKKLLLILLVVLCWLFFVVGLLFTSSKCARAYTFPNTDFTVAEGQRIQKSQFGNPMNCYLSSNPSTDISTAPNISVYRFVLTCIDDFGKTEVTGNGVPASDFSTITFSSRITIPAGANASSSITSTFNNNYVMTFTSSNTASINEGFFSWNITIPSSSGGYTQDDLDNAYAEGQLNALNTASSSTNGSGTVYTEYSGTSMRSEMSNAYNKGKLYALNYLSSATARGGSGTVYTEYSAESFVTEINNVYNAGYNEGYSAGEYQGEQNVISNPSDYDLYTQAELDSELLAGKVYVANLISDYWYGVCSTNNYSSCSHPSIDENNYTDDYVNTLLDLINSSAYLDGVADAELRLLNYASSQNGTGMVYSSYDFTDFDNELVTIYSNGAAGTGSNVGYSGGYTAGVNSVLGNLSYYDLYSKNDYDNAITSARASGYSSGYQQGKLDYENVDVSLPNTVISIASVPLVVLSSMFNFDILGINLFALITSILSLLIAIWVIKKIAGK